ncbi:phage holin family protein [Methylobacterium sp. J-077]|uniref:phage holin family protein n=1 Tax=Methylobacterium sp. J-077 TaxID=2836656 RepID=UPI001FBBD080|nr:phage holin family protein [Methylobacterium sp. J-077]MCJ2123838.1 phage holin family protein [Methylobacterium sp. J-077]
MRHRADTTLALLVAALRESAAHMEALLTLARTELDGNLRALVSLIAIVGTIPVLLIVTFFLGLDAVVKLLALPFGSEAPAALIVAAPFLIVALGLGWLGLRRMALSNLEPWRTWRQVKQDARAVARPRA